MKYVLCTLCFFFLLSFPASVWAENAELVSPASASTDEAKEKLRIQDTERLKGLAVLEAEMNAMLQAGTEKLVTIRNEMAAYRSAYQQIILSQGIAGASPMGFHELYTRLADLNSKLREITESLEELRDQVEAQAESMTISRTELDFKALERHSPELTRNFENYLDRLQKLQMALEDKLVVTKRRLAATTKLTERTSRLTARMERDLLDKWENFFFARKEPLFSQEFWEQPFSPTDWFSLRLPVWQVRIKSATDKLRSKLLFSSMLFALITILGCLIGKRFFPKPEHRDVMRKLAIAWVITSAGISILFTDDHFFPETTGVASILGASIFGFGTMWGGHIIRKNFGEYNNPSNTPLILLFIGGTLIIVLGLPEKLAIPLWLLLAAVVCGVMKCRVTCSSERLALHVWFWMLILLAVVAVMGYGRLAAFGGMLLFIGYYTYNIAMAGICLVTCVVSRLPETGLYPFVRALAMGISSPLIWTASFAVSAYWIYDFFGAGVFKATAALNLGWQGVTLHVLNVIIIVALFFLTRAAVVVAQTYVNRIGKSWPRSKRGTMDSLKTIAAYVFWALFGILALGALGVNLTSLTVIAGGLSVGIGFGMQTIFNNFIGGLILLFGGSLQQGDIIQIGELWCIVKKINIRTTVVQTFENATIIIPNADLVSTQVTNWTKNNPTLRRDIIVGVAYGTDTELVKNTLLKVAAAHPRVQDNPAPWVMFSDFGASSLTFTLRVSIDDIDYALATTSDLRYEIDKAFREQGIEIAFPQLDIHVRSVEKDVDETQKTQQAQGDTTADSAKEK